MAMLALPGYWRVFAKLASLGGLFAVVIRAVKPAFKAATEYLPCDDGWHNRVDIG